MNILLGLAQHYSIHFFGFQDKKGTISDHISVNAALQSICTTIHTEIVRSERNFVWLLVDLITSMASLQPFTSAKYRSRNMFRAVQKLLRTHDVALAHADSLQSGQYIANLHVPRLLTNHNVEHIRLATHAARQRSVIYRVALRIQAALTKLYERKILNSIGNCVVVSEKDRAALLPLVKDVRFFVVANGTDTSAPALPAAPREALTALWMGGMNDPFNREAVLHFAYKVFPRIRERIPGFTWYVVGRDPPKALESLARSPSSGIEIAGFIPEIREAYARCAIVVVPLLSGGGTKLKVLEAMAMGRAIVTTPIGAEGIDARDGVEMEIAIDDDDFAQKVCSLLRSDQRRDQMAAAARKLAEINFSWDIVNRQMHQAVRTVIKQPTRGRPSAECAV